MQKILLTLVIFITLSFPATAQKSEFVSVTPSIRYQYIGTYDEARLTKIQNSEIPEELGPGLSFTAPKNAVKLYRVEYMSVIPEQDNRPTLASGLIAIPATGAKRMPMFSYQHGTVFGKDWAPSFPEKSFETRLAIAQFAGQGYIVIGADYFGLGTSIEKDSYIVLNSQVQASLDMYEAAKLILTREGIYTTDLFIGGWSQGGVVTMAFLERLENNGIPVKAAATAAAQCDGYVMTHGFLQNPRKIDAPWVTTMFILTAFSFEEYYRMPGLARGLFTDEQYATAHRVYMKDSTLAYKDYPLDLHKLIRPEYFNATYYTQSQYGKLMSTMHPYRWLIKTPLKMFYGDVDQSLTIGLARLPYEFQKALGNTKVEAISLGADANHRLTYGRAVPKWKNWFDGMVSK